MCPPPRPRRPRRRGRGALAALGALDDGPRRGVDRQRQHEEHQAGREEGGLCSGWFAASPNSLAITAASV